MIDHPEYNSTLILRSETLEIHDGQGDAPHQAPTFPHHTFVRAIRRKLLARRPGRDASLEQLCAFYSPSLHEESPVDIVVLTPLPQPGTSLPYYHPAVKHLAIRYIHSDPPSLRIELIPLEGAPIDFNSRLFRTSLALLETVHRYGWGAITNYQKRVNHDRLVPREQYQDLYLVMRERHKHLVDTWQEVTDPLKHVFEVCFASKSLVVLTIFADDEVSIGHRDRNIFDTFVERKLSLFRYTEHRRAIENLGKTPRRIFGFWVSNSDHIAKILTHHAPIAAGMVCLRIYSSQRAMKVLESTFAHGRLGNTIHHRHGHNCKSTLLIPPSTFLQHRNHLRSFILAHSSSATTRTN